MFAMRTFLLSLALICALGVGAQPLTPSIIPQPLKTTQRQGVFTISPTAHITYSEGLHDSADYLAEYLPLHTEPYRALREGDVVMMLNANLAHEEYTLDVSRNCIIMQGGSAAAIHNAIESLLQLLPAEVYAKQMTLPQSVMQLRVEDKPHYAYRGFMLDVTRTWVSVDELKHFIEALAHHKINHLHLHLSDDEGWRIEILSHPELTAIGAYRGGDSPVMPRYGRWSEKYGGYYTQAEMRDVVAFAARRNIVIIPEIDLPGHSHNIARVKPDILCNYTPSLTSSAGYDTRGVFCVAKEDNYALLEDIFRELADIFPSPYIHIGGDEVSTSQWQHCPDCKALFEREGMTGYGELQSHFMMRVAAILEGLGKLSAVWNEAAEDGRMALSTRVHCWEGMKQARAILSKGYPTIIEAGEYFYFDMRQGPREGGHDWAGVFDARKTYSFLAERAQLEQSAGRVEGVEAAFFSEAYLSNRHQPYNFLYYQTYPRICALSEVAWSARGEWEEFYSRLVAHYQRMDNMRLSFRIFPPEVSYSEGVLTATNDDSTAIYYTTLGSDEEHLYTEPILTPKPYLYAFRSRTELGLSPEAGVPERFATSRPKVHITTSLPVSDKAPLSRAESYSAAARTTRAARSGDWVEYRFERAVVGTRRMEFHTGTPRMPRFILREGYVEVSSDGEHFTRVGELHDGGIVLEGYAKPLKALRVVCTADANGASYCLIQPPVILPEM